MPIQVNVTTKVNSKSIRREVYNGREHWILPSYTLPANVIMNGGLYPASEIDAHYKGLEGTLAPLGHPQVNGKYVSAFSPEGLNLGFVGAWNRNVKKSGNRIYVEKWVDVNKAKESEGGRQLLERVEAIERGDDVPPIHTSVAIFLDQIAANEQERENGYDWIAKFNAMDHDAILLDEVGAATPEDGVGLMVNADSAVPLKANSGALIGESYREKESRIERAVKEKFITSNEDYAFVADFTESQAVIIKNGKAQLFGYKSDNGVIIFDEEGTDVARTESWMAIAVNKIKSIFSNNHEENKEGEMPLTQEEKTEIIKGVSEALAANLDEKLKPLNESVTALEANQKTITETLTANSRAEEKTKRDAVAAIHGEIVANALNGEALDAMYKSLGESPKLGANTAENKQVTGTPDYNTYFKEQ